MRAMKRIVIKLGTNALLNGTERLSCRYMLGLVQQIAELRSLGLQIIIVSSGAVAAGRSAVTTAPSNEIAPREALASIGQVKLMQAWSELFALFEMQVGQILVTKENFLRKSRGRMQATIATLLQLNAIPILNENDAAGTSGASIGNNDSLAALVANLMNADTIILLTDQEGLYTADPRFNKAAELIPCVKRIDEEILSYAGGSYTAVGTGGMATKVDAALHASKSGAQTIIASSLRPNILIDLFQGKSIGTWFLIEGSVNQKKKKSIFSAKEEINR